MSQPKVYLAGPISGTSYGECTDWREHAISRLAQFGIRGLSPMRCKEYLSHLTSISADGHEYAHLGAFATPRSVMTRDHFDATRCDMLLVNFIDAKIVSIGTVMEIAWAFTRQIPVVLASNNDVHKHMMVDEAVGFRAETLEHAIDIAIGVLK